MEEIGEIESKRIESQEIGSEEIENKETGSEEVENKEIKNEGIENKEIEMQEGAFEGIGWLQKGRNAVKEILQGMITGYMLLIIAVMPFYYRQGYSYIGTDKHNFFRTVSVYAGMVIVPLTAAYVLLHMICLRKEKHSWKKVGEEFFVSFSITDICALCFGAAAVLSYICTDYWEEAFWGTKGWYMGLMTQLLFLGIYFVISRLWKTTDWVVLSFLPVSFLVFLLGYLNRFGIYPISMESARPGFISTIGNINWYCGYLVTVFFGGVYFFWSGRIKQRWKKILMLLYIGLGFGSLVTQGSSSGIVTLAVIMLVLFAMSALDKEGIKMKAFWEIGITLSAVCLLTFIIRLWYPDAITYQEAATNLFTFSPLPLLLGIVSIGSFCWVKYKIHQKQYPQKVFCLLAKGVIGGTIFLGGLFILLIAINTKYPGSFGKLSNLSVFTFSPSWGSNRGATWMAGLVCFEEQSFWRKLVGVGPDCMAAYLAEQRNPALSSMLKEIFLNNRLTNAHNEWITMLVNLGLFGMLSYIAFIVSAILRFLKVKEKSTAIGAAGLCVLAYTINNMFSFQQSMSAVTLFIIMGIGEAYARKKKV